MDIQRFIGMPLRYAISVLHEENITYRVERTWARSRFFQCDENELYVVRTRMENGIVVLLVDATLKKSESVQRILKMEIFEDD